MTLTVERLPGAAQLAERAVELLEGWGAESLAERGMFHVVLSGGSTPRATYRVWGQRSRLDWGRVHLWFGDERCVPPQHPDSNAGMVEAELVADLPLPPRMLRMRGEDPDPENAAREYGRALKTHFDAGGALDVALQGIGGDGHTASLFPGQEAVRETHHLCVATLAPGGNSKRITLTPPAIKRARYLLFLAAGPDKAEIVRTVVEGTPEPVKYPAQLFLRDETLSVTLLVDEAAARLLA